MTDVTGWSELLEGKLFSAVFKMFDGVFNGWFVAIIFFMFQTLLYIKTKNITLTWVCGLLFASLYASSILLNEFTNYILFLTLSVQLAGILLMLFIKK